MRAAGGILRLSQFGEQPGDLGGLKRHVDLDGGMAGHRSGNPAGSGLRVVGLARMILCGENVFKHLLKFAALQAHGRRLDSQGTGAKGFSFKAVSFQFGGDASKRHHLGWKQVDEQGHEETLTLHLLGLPFAEDLFKQDALMGDMLVDDPEALVVRGKDEGVAHLAEGLERGEGVEGGVLDDAFLSIRDRNSRRLGAILIADNYGGLREGKAARWRSDRDG